MKRNPTNAGLVLEGGGLRGVFTSGVLRRLMDEGVWFGSVYGVSMGACNGADYVARQPERYRCAAQSRMDALRAFPAT